MPPLAEAPRFMPPVPRAESPARLEIEPAPNVCVHELLHGIVLNHLGGAIHEMSVIPEGDSNGRVIVGGHITPEAFQIMAAASSVPLPGYVPEGTGSDHYQIRVIERRGGHSFDQAKSLASRIIATYEPDVIHMAAWMLHERKVVHGSVKGILEQAAHKIQIKRMQNGVPEYTFDHQLNTKKELPKESQSREENIPETGDFTVIETLTEERTKISMFTDGNLIASETGCSVCGARGGSHHEDCIHFTATPNELQDT